MRENETEAGKVRWVRPDGPDDVGGPVGRRWGRPDKDGDGRTKMGTNPDRVWLGDRSKAKADQVITGWHSTLLMK